ncbi:regulatory signaling modulator protein AmpE [Ectothiorhodospiraceae bacterium WFHF3C12]|nr:regulatory signaling modulator protein AmpE [Ectothiorhodospiraceae bacterium WFHF3C12]
MRLIAVLISLWLNRYPDQLQVLRQTRYIHDYLRWMQRQLQTVSAWDSVAGVVLVLAPWALAVGLLQWWIGNWLLGLGELLLGVAALLFAFGPSRVDDHLERFIEAWRAGNMDAAREQAAWLAERPAGDIPEHSLTTMALEGLFVRAHERLLGPFFWLVLLGPVGPVVFRLGRLCREYVAANADAGRGFANAVNGFNWLAAWLPARASAAAFALVGSFVEAFQGWNAARGFYEDNERAVLVGAGMGAMGLPVNFEEVDVIEGTLHDARALIVRATMIWLAVIAVLTLAGWVR